MRSQRYTVEIYVWHQPERCYIREVTYACGASYHDARRRAESAVAGRGGMSTWELRSSKRLPFADVRCNGKTVWTEEAPMEIVPSVGERGF